MNECVCVSVPCVSSFSSCLVMHEPYSTDCVRLRDVTSEKLHVCRQPPKSVAQKGLGLGRELNIIKNSNRELGGSREKPSLLPIPA